MEQIAMNTKMREISICVKLYVCLICVCMER